MLLSFLQKTLLINKTSRNLSATMQHKTISSKSQQSAIDYNVFEGQTVTGLPRFTLTRGHCAVTEGKMTSTAGYGQFVPRQAQPAVNRALSVWKELTAPRPVVRGSIPVTGV